MNTTATATPTVPNDFYAFEDDAFDFYDDVIAHALERGHEVVIISDPSEPDPGCTSRPGAIGCIEIDGVRASLRVWTHGEQFRGGRWHRVPCSPYFNIHAVGGERSTLRARTALLESATNGALNGAL